MIETITLYIQINYSDKSTLCCGSDTFIDERQTVKKAERQSSANSDLRQTPLTRFLVTNLQQTQMQSKIQNAKIVRNIFTSKPWFNKLRNTKHEMNKQQKDNRLWILTLDRPHLHASYLQIFNKHKCEWNENTAGYFLKFMRNTAGYRFLEFH